MLTHSITGVGTKSAAQMLISICLVRRRHMLSHIFRLYELPFQRQQLLLQPEVCFSPCNFQLCFKTVKLRAFGGELTDGSTETDPEFCLVTARLQPDRWAPLSKMLTRGDGNVGVWWNQTWPFRLRSCSQTSELCLSHDRIRNLPPVWSEGSGRESHTTLNLFFLWSSYSQQGR